MGWQLCPKCGEPMRMQAGIGYSYYWVCPNGCKQDYKNFKTTASSMTEEEYKK